MISMFVHRMNVAIQHVEADEEVVCPPLLKTVSLTEPGARLAARKPQSTSHEAGTPGVPETMRGFLFEC